MLYQGLARCLIFSSSALLVKGVNWGDSMRFPIGYERMFIVTILCNHCLSSRTLRWGPFICRGSKGTPSMTQMRECSPWFPSDLRRLPRLICLLQRCVDSLELAIVSNDSDERIGIRGDSSKGGSSCLFVPI